MTKPFDAHLVGLPPGYMPMHIADAGSWRIAAELIRRHPDDLRVIEMHPGDGQHDCLGIVRQDGKHRYGLSTVLRINRKMIGHVLPGRLAEQTEWRPTWIDILTSNSLIDDVIKPLEETYELDSPSATPPLSPASVGSYVIAETLNQGLRAGRTLLAFNGVFDSSGMGGSFVHRDAFRHFPGLESELKDANDAQLEHHPAYHFWFGASRDRGQAGPLHFGLDSWNGCLWTSNRAAVDILGECGGNEESLATFVSELMTSTTKGKK